MVRGIAAKLLLREAKHARAIMAGGRPQVPMQAKAAKSLAAFAAGNVNRFRSRATGSANSILSFGAFERRPDQVPEFADALRLVIERRPFSASSFEG